MMERKGFTLIEIIVVIIIVGVFACFAFPNYIISVEQSRASAAQNNLLAISAAQEKFDEDYSSYCISSGSNPTGDSVLCGDSINDLDLNLKLGISTADTFGYSCTNGAAPYQCIATDGSNPGQIKLTLGVSVLGAATVSCCEWAPGPVCNAGGSSCPAPP